MKNNWNCSDLWYCTPSILPTRPIAHRNIFYRRTDAIEEQLKKYGINPIRVHRHNVYNVDYYVVEFENVTDEKDISYALGIPEEWIGFISTSPWTYYIKEKELNDKYCDENGELVFLSTMDKIVEEVEKQLTIIKKDINGESIFILGKPEVASKVCDFLDGMIDDEINK